MLCRDGGDLVLTVAPERDAPFRDEVRSILCRLRTRDARELDACGLDFQSALAAFSVPAVLARVFSDAGQPAAVITFHRLTPKALVVSLVATDDWRAVARAVVRWGVRVAKPTLLSLGYERAECRTMEGHDEAIALLERLGFVRECPLPCFGGRGTAFVQYAWRLIDHVPVQLAEGAAASPSAADAGVASGGGVAPTQTTRAAPGAVHLALRAGADRVSESDAAEDAARRVRCSITSV